VLSEHLGAAGALLDAVFTAPRFKGADIDVERGLMAVEAAQVPDDMFRYPFQLAFRGAFGEGGYGLPTGGLPHTVAALTVADVRGWLEQALLGARPVVVVVGDVVPSRAAAVLAAVFERYPARPASDSWEPSDWTATEPVAELVCREKAQSALAMVFPGPSRRDPRRGAAAVWAAIASGLAGRMFEALRERRSLAYTVLASAWPKRRAGALVTYIATSPEREAEARDAMLAELARFAGEPVAAAELQQAVSYLSGQAEVGRQSGAALAGEILEAWLAGSGLGEIADPTAIYRGVTAADVRQLAADYLDTARRAEGLVRGNGRAATGSPAAVPAATAPAGV
jgi:zinc protease